MVTTDYSVTVPGPYNFEIVLPLLGDNEAVLEWLSQASPADLTGSLAEARALAEELDVDIRLSTPQGFPAGRVWRVEEVEDDGDDYADVWHGWDGGAA